MNLEGGVGYMLLFLTFLSVFGPLLRHHKKWHKKKNNVTALKFNLLRIADFNVV